MLKPLPSLSFKSYVTFEDMIIPIYMEVNLSKITLKISGAELGLEIRFL